MLSRSSRTWSFYRSLYPSITTLSARLSSSSSKTAFPSSKLTQSYYHHASDLPLLHHTLGQHLDQLAQAHPNHECFAFRGEGNKRYTYKSFLDEVDSLATSLIELGFQKGDRIGVWLPNTSQNCVMSYATSRIGLIKVLKLFKMPIY
jgi:non-ribosomal peptide synthetase component E (peptide arylation enzyme)